MAEYKVEVTTGDQLEAGTSDYIYLTIIGSKGVSERKELDNYGRDFTAGQTSTYVVKSNASLGKILLVKLEKDPFFLMDSDQWFCSNKAELKLKGLGESMEVWESVEAMKDIFWHYKTPISEHVIEHWEDDDFYGFQFMNSINPNVIERCTELPANFPVTEEMVKPFLKEGTTLAKEMVKGNIFICNYKRLDGISTRKEDGVPLPLTPGLCLLYVNPEKKLMPIAIQLYQKPSETNPIFLPSDPKHDWLLAKMFLKNCDLLWYLGVFHHMNTHMLGEGFTVATLRNFPAIHPLYKSSLGASGLIEVMAKHLSLITYSELCLPENIAARGVESIPNFYYRDDGLKVWDIVHSYVKGMVEQFYPSDNDVRKDTELQAWINDIFSNTFLGRKESEIPSSFKNVAELVKFLTFVVYTCSAQHSAVNNGQFDYYHWLLNGTILMCKPPPTVKGKATMKTILEMLPRVGESVSFMATAWLLTKRYADNIFLGDFPVERFDEPGPEKLRKELKEKLDALSVVITKRNTEIPVPYNYLNPSQLESSITI
ncbi:arachidonate 12-lipoxygenase, 12R-type-like [Diretmus argenteus]